jgi:hypothetical protein
MGAFSANLAHLPDLGAAQVDGKPVCLLHDENGKRGLSLRRTFEAAGVRVSANSDCVCVTLEMEGE